MGHSLQAIIASESIMEQLTERFPQVRLVRLRQGFALAPMLPDLAEAFGPYSQAREQDWQWMSTTLSQALADLSKFGPVAYVETDYFGGAGDQGAIAWDAGQVVCGPSRREIGPINQALARIGVRRCGTLDEFDSLGLQYLRHVDEPDDECYQDGYIEKEFARYHK